MSLLKFIEKIGNKIPDLSLLFFFALILVLFASCVLSFVDFELYLPQAGAKVAAGQGSQKSGVAGAREVVGKKANAPEADKKVGVAAAGAAGQKFGTAPAVASGVAAGQGGVGEKVGLAEGQKFAPAGGGGVGGATAEAEQGGVAAVGAVDGTAEQGGGTAAGAGGVAEATGQKFGPAPAVASGMAEGQDGRGGQKSSPAPAVPGQGGAGEKSGRSPAVGVMGAVPAGGAEAREVAGDKIGPAEGSVAGGVSATPPGAGADKKVGVADAEGEKIGVGGVAECQKFAPVEGGGVGGATAEAEAGAVGGAAGAAGTAGENAPPGQRLVIKNFLAPENFLILLGRLSENFISFPPLALTLIISLAIGLAEGSGFLAALLARASCLAGPCSVVPAVLILSIASHLIGDGAYVFLMPISALLFASAGRHPVAGLATAFAGLAGGFCAGFAPSVIDPIMAGFTQAAARLIDPTFSVNVLTSSPWLAAWA